MEEEKLGGVGCPLVGFKQYVELRRAQSRICKPAGIVLVVLALLLGFSMGTRVNAAQGSGMSFRSSRGGSGDHQRHTGGTQSLVRRQSWKSCL